MKEFINAVIAIIAGFFIKEPINDIILPQLNKYLNSHTGVTIFMLAVFIIYSILATITSLELKRKIKKLNFELNESQKLNEVQPSQLKASNSIYIDQYKNPFCTFDKSPLYKTRLESGALVYRCHQCPTIYEISVIEIAITVSK